MTATLHAHHSLCPWLQLRCPHSVQLGGPRQVHPRRARGTRQAVSPTAPTTSGAPYAMGYLATAIVLTQSVLRVTAALMMLVYAVHVPVVAHLWLQWHLLAMLMGVPLIPLLTCTA